MEKPVNPHVVPQRTVVSRVLTPAGWVHGTLRMPEQERILEYLNKLEPFFRLTDVVLPLRQTPHSFFALGRESVLLVAPTQEADITELQTVAGTIHKMTSWLLPGGVVLDGILDLDPGERVSDRLLSRTGFVVLRECSLVFPHGGVSLPGQFTYDVMALQSARAVGVTELTSPPPL